jgi:hypothetical protein
MSRKGDVRRINASLAVHGLKMPRPIGSHQDAVSFAPAMLCLNKCVGDL